MLCIILEKHKKKHPHLFEGVNKDYREGKFGLELGEHRVLPAENNLRRRSEYAEAKRHDRACHMHKT